MSHERLSNLKLLVGPRLAIIARDSGVGLDWCDFDVERFVFYDLTNRMRAGVSMHDIDKYLQADNWKAIDGLVEEAITKVSSDMGNLFALADEAEVAPGAKRA